LDAAINNHHDREGRTPSLISPTCPYRYHPSSVWINDGISYK
jgi:hypothetical protein